MLKLKLQFFGHLMQRADSGKDPDAGKVWGAGGEGDDRGWDVWMASPTWWTCVWVNSGSWWWTGRPGVLRFMGCQRVGHDWATELNWTVLFSILDFFVYKTNLYLSDCPCPSHWMELGSHFNLTCTSLSACNSCPIAYNMLICFSSTQVKPLKKKKTE